MPHVRYETKPGQQLQVDWKENLRMTTIHSEVICGFNEFCNYKMDNIYPTPVTNISVKRTSNGNSSIVHDGFVPNANNMIIYGTHEYPKLTNAVYILDNTKVCLGSFAFISNVLLSTSADIA